MDLRFRVSARLAALAAVMILGALPFPGRAIAGQAITSDATIVGQVTDESKGVLPGVTVTATSPALQTPSVTSVTDARGEYRLTPLPVGTYSIEYTLQGFRTIRQEGVRLTGGFTARLDIVLTVGQLEETITVSGAAPVVDVSATDTTTQLTRESLELIPTSANRTSFLALLQQVPGVRADIEAGGALSSQNLNVAAFGQTGQSWQNVDGVVTKNPRDSEAGQVFDMNAFEEATVSTLGHDASVPNRGVNINSIVKSGGDQFNGKVFYAATSSRFESQQATGGGRSIKIRDDLIGELGGRIVRSKLWFWFGARNQRNHVEVLDCFKPDGSKCDVPGPGRFMTAKVTGQLNPTNRFTGLYMWGRTRDYGNLSSLSPWESRRDINWQPHVIKGEWQVVASSKLIMTGNVAHWSGLSGTACNPDIPPSPNRFPSLSDKNVDVSDCHGVATTDSVTRFVTGLNPRAGERLNESRYQGRFNLSYFAPDFFHGGHEFKAGFDVFQAPHNRSHVGRGPAGNYQLTFRSGVADQIALWNYPIAKPKLALRYYAGYLADSWSVGRKLTLNLGIRYSYDKGYEDPSCRGVADGPSAVLYPAQCYTGVTMAVYGGFVPRLRAAYDIGGDGKTVLKGGWGRYLVMRNSLDVLNVAMNVVDQMNFRWRDLNGNRDYDPGEVNLDPNGPDFISRTIGTGGTAQQGGIPNPNETAPYTDEYSLQFERQLRPNLGLRVTAVHSRALNSTRLGNPKRPYEAYTIPVRNPDPGRDGVVGTADDPGTFITYYDYPAAYAGIKFQEATIVNDPAADSRFSTLELGLTKAFSNNWQFRTSYTASKKAIPLTPNAGSFSSQDPNAEIFAADNTWEWQGRVAGSYLLPYGILFAGNFEHRSGNPWARTASFRGGVRIPSLTLRVEEIGAQRLPSLNLLTLRGDKRFKLQEKQEVQMGVTLYNALNTDTPTGVTAQSGSSFGVVTTRVLPRLLEFEVRYSF